MNYYNVIADDVYLWDYNAFTTRTGYNWPKNIFSNQTLPPRTQPSENLGSLPKGTRLELKEILFGNYARQNSKRYTVCLFEATLSGGARKQGFVYVMYADQPQVMQETPIINRNRDPESFTSRCQQLANNVRNAISNGWTAFWEDEEEEISDDKNIFDSAARERGIAFVENNIWAYYKGYQFWGSTGGSHHILVFKKTPEKGNEDTSEGYYDVTRTIINGKITCISKEFKTTDEGNEIRSDSRNIGNYQGIQTYCNYVATVISLEYGAPNLQCFNGTERNANDIKNLLKNGDYNNDSTCFEEVTWEQAEEYASQGGFAFAVGEGHIATLTGGFDGSREKKNLKLYQAGKSFGYLSYKYAWLPTHVTTFYKWRKS